MSRELDLDLLRGPMLQVLYNLFQWPLLKASRLAVIGISNTHDLPDKFLPRIARCAAALAGIAELSFAPVCTLDCLLHIGLLH